jgi:hypothetical protein
VLRSSPAACSGYTPKAVDGLAPVFGFVSWNVAASAAVAATLGLIRQRQTRGSRDGLVSSQRSFEDLRALTYRQFEEVVADLYRRQGYRVEEVGGPGDGGVDLVLRRDGSPRLEHLVHCKRWASWKVGVSEVRLYRCPHSLPKPPPRVAGFIPVAPFCLTSLRRPVFCGDNVSRSVVPRPTPTLLRRATLQ